LGHNRGSLSVRLTDTIPELQVYGRAGRDRDADTRAVSRHRVLGELGPHRKAVLIPLRAAACQTGADSW